ncbi:MAG: hypothetical protein ACRC0C_13745 [Gibbsiella quercinecans]|uniref:hypothetical protein n=1 Tax=Gibbsiella quercinecans TaxID=929813 RepID=UPI003F3255E9
MLNSKGIKSARNTEVRQANKPQFGDHQINSVMAIAKGNMVPPMELVLHISDWLSEKNCDGLIQKITVVL